MRTEQQQKFIDALKSDDYKQGKGLLALSTSKGIEYCCWGVCAVVNGLSIDFDTNLVEEFLEEDSESVNCDAEGLILGDVELLPKEFIEEFGLNDKIQRYLASMNDGSWNSYKGKVLRAPLAPRRDFEFIARFLEVILPKE